MLNNVLPLWTLPLCEEHSQVLKMQLQAGAEIPLLPLAALISRALPELRVAFQALTKRDECRAWLPSTACPARVLLPFPCPHLRAASHQILTAGRGLEWDFPLCTAPVAACHEHSPWTWCAGSQQCPWGGLFQEKLLEFKKKLLNKMAWKCLNTKEEG